MKYCIHCGQELSDSAKFCSKCGKPQDSKSEVSRDLSFINNEEYLKTPEGKEKYLALIKELYSYFDSISNDYEKYDELINEIASLEGADFNDTTMDIFYGKRISEYFSDICYEAEAYARKIKKHYEASDLAKQLISSSFTNPNIISQIQWLITNDYDNTIDEACNTLENTIVNYNYDLKYVLKTYLLGQVSMREKGLPKGETPARAAFFPKKFFDRGYMEIYMKLLKEEAKKAMEEDDV